MTTPSPGPVLPELGPLLGRLTEITGRSPAPDLGLDPVRLELVTALFERGRAARAALAAGDGVEARTTLERDAWLALWSRAVAAATDRTLAALDGRLERAAARAGAPGRQRRALGPSEEDRAVIRARLDAAGIALEQALARPLAGRRDWPAGLRGAAGALEESWDELERTAGEILREWEPVVARLEGWRPPTLAYAGPAIVLVLAALGVGLAIGGYLPRPAWLDPVARWFWSWPWP